MGACKQVVTSKSTGCLAAHITSTLRNGPGSRMLNIAQHSAADFMHSARCPAVMEAQRQVRLRLSRVTTQVTSAANTSMSCESISGTSPANRGRSIRFGESLVAVQLFVPSLCSERDQPWRAQEDNQGNTRHTQSVLRHRLKCVYA